MAAQSITDTNNDADVVVGNDHLTGVVKVHSKTYGGGGLKYYLFKKFRAYLFKNINPFSFDIGN